VRIPPSDINSFFAQRQPFECFLLCTENRQAGHPKFRLKQPKDKLSVEKLITK